MFRRRGIILQLAILILSAAFFASAPCSGFSSDSGVSVSAEPDGDSDNPRVIIERILAREEFHGVKKQQMTWFEKIRQKAAEFLINLLVKLMSRASFQSIDKILIWISVAAALILLTVLTIRLWKRKMARQSSTTAFADPSESAPAHALPWEKWLARAHEAATAGDWREAVHLAYRGGISFLELNAALPTDRARTPREYLRMLPSASSHRAPLAALTRKFEITWYGSAQAVPEYFSESLDCLESMGCHARECS